MSFVIAAVQQWTEPSPVVKTSLPMTIKSIAPGGVVVVSSTAPDPNTQIVPTNIHVCYADRQWGSPGGDGSSAISSGCPQQSLPYQAGDMQFNVPGIVPGQGYFVHVILEQT